MVRVRGRNIAQSPYQSNNISTQYQNILFNVNTGNRIEVNKTYTISFKGKPGDKYRTTSGTYGVSSSATTITVDNNGIGIGIFTTKEEFTTQSTGILSNYSENNTLPITDICIAEGTFDELPFEPYYTPQEKELDLEDLEVYENGYFSRENGKWYLNNVWGKINASDYSFGMSSITIDGQSYSQFSTPSTSPTPINAGNNSNAVCCNKFLPGLNVINKFYINSQNRIVVVAPIYNGNYITTLEDFNTNIKSNMYIVGKLITPSKTEITNQTLINQLNDIYKLMSYDGTTIIETECEEGNMPIIISASALLDSAKVIEDLETRIEVLESEE